MRALTEAFPEIDADTDEAEALGASLRTQLLENPDLDASFRRLLEQTLEPGRLADRIAAVLDGPPETRVRVLLEGSVPKRLRLVLELFAKAKSAAEMREKIDSEVRRELGKNQRDAVLREQLRAIQKQLGGKDGDADPLREKLEALELPDEVREQVDRELDRLGAGSGPDANITRKYLELVAELPWNERAPASDDLGAVEQILEDDHEGLEEPKKRILEHMAVLKLSGKARGTILCLVGPPGVGKTSLAQSVARATGRPLSARERSAACATRPRSAVIGAPTWARSPVASSRRCARRR